MFQSDILQGMPDHLPEYPAMDPKIPRAPRRKLVLSAEEQILAVRNALRYIPPHHHRILAKEFAEELQTHGRIYMHRYRPQYEMKARAFADYPAVCPQAAAIMVMIQNNLDPAVAQYPYELITYGGNGAVFQNWAQYRLTMQYLATMTQTQTLVIYSGHPLGLFPASIEAPRVVVTNGMMVPHYSRAEDWDRYNALGVTQYGQMTAGSYMYIGPQGIVHGTTLTLLNAGRRIRASGTLQGLLFVSSGLGGMSGAQAKAAVIAGAVGVIAEINPAAVHKRHAQGWVDEVYEDLDVLLPRIRQAKAQGEAVSMAYLGNIVDLWERLADSDLTVEVGSDQTSLHNPYAGGYYPASLSFEVATAKMIEDPAGFQAEVQESLRRHVRAIERLCTRGMYFFDYGNAFLLEAQRAGAAVMDAQGKFCYPSYVQDIMGPLCFDYGFGPFRWVCTSGDPCDLRKTDHIAAEVLQGLLAKAPDDIRQQWADNLLWIQSAEENRLVVGSQARILYSDGEGRIELARRLNQAVADGTLSAPVVIGRDHHDVSGTDSPFRETSNLYDGSQFTADMAVQNFVGDGFRGATWISLHNGGGVGWGEAINGGFGLVLDGTADCERRLTSMLHWDVNNGIARRSWGRNAGARTAIQREMARTPELRVTIGYCVEDGIL